MTVLHLFIYISDERVTWASARLNRKATTEEHRQAYRKARAGVEQLFTTIEFDSEEDAEHARTRLAAILRHKFGIGAPTKARKIEGVTKLKAIVLPEANDDLCWPNREFRFPPALYK